MSLDAARSTKALKLSHSEELQLKFFFTSNDFGAYLWAEKWGVKASVLVDECFLESQQAKYRDTKIKELYCTWMQAFIDADMHPPVDVVDGLEADEPDHDDLTDSARLSAEIHFEDALPPGDMALPDLSSMTVAQATLAIENLTGEDLLRLRDIEGAGKDRKGVLAAIEKKLDEVMG